MIVQSAAGKLKRVTLELRCGTPVRHKQSGWGREGEEVIHEYTETKSGCIGL
jgi:hypothetical protein